METFHLRILWKKHGTIIFYYIIFYLNLLYFLYSHENTFFEINNENDIQNCFEDQARELKGRTDRITNEELKLRGNATIAYQKFKLSSSANFFDLEADVGPSDEGEEEDEVEEGFSDQHDTKNEIKTGLQVKHQFGKVKVIKGSGDSVTFFNVSHPPLNQPWVRCAGKQ
jgi:hypothetical protein